MRLERPASRRLASHLSLLSLAALLPVAVVVVLFAFYIAREDRRAFERAVTERARGLSTAIDAEIRTSLTALLTLAQAAELQQGDLDAFSAFAQRARAANPEWLDLKLALSDTGGVVLSLLALPGHAKVADDDRDAFDGVVRTGQPGVGSLQVDRDMRDRTFPLHVPVVTERGLHYVLSAVFDQRKIEALVATQQLPDRWLCAVFDRQHHVVARSHSLEQLVAGAGLEPLTDALRDRRDGFLRGQAIQGKTVYMPFVTSPYSGWSVAVGVALDDVDARGRWLAAIFLLGVALALAAGFALARGLGRRLTDPVGWLALQARATDHGSVERMPPISSTIAEFNELAQAMQDARAAVRDRMALQHQWVAVNRNATTPLFIVGPDRYCRYANPAAERMTGYASSDLIGRNLDELLPHASADGTQYPAPDGLFHAPLRGEESCHGEDVLIDRSGRSIPVSYAASALTLDDGSTGIVVELRAIADDFNASGQRERMARVDVGDAAVKPSSISRGTTGGRAAAGRICGYHAAAETGREPGTGGGRRRPARS